MKFKVGDKVRFVGTIKHDYDTGVRKSCDITNKTGVITEFLGEDANYQGIVKNWYACTIHEGSRFAETALVGVDDIPCGSFESLMDSLKTGETV